MSSPTRCASGEILNVVCVVRRDDWRLESWFQPGTAEEWLADLAGWHEDVLTIIRAVEAPFKWALLSREPLRRFAQGRACVIGDAAHPALPLLGQGACLAIEDALVWHAAWPSTQPPYPTRWLVSRPRESCRTAAIRARVRSEPATAGVSRTREPGRRG